jgi:3-oxoacyl-[acyl-carrier protein] reductase
MVAAVSRNRESLEQLLKELGGAEKGHTIIARDLTSDGAPRETVAELEARFGKIDIVVHNLGGTMDISDPFCPVEAWRKIWRFNVEVAIELNALLLPAMQSRGWGRVVHISSAAAAVKRGALAYGVVKAGLNAYVERIGQIVAASGVVVTAVAPGAVSWPGSHWDKVAVSNPERVRRYLDEHVAARRFAKLEEVSAFVLYLCSEHASYFSGAILSMDGGTS